MIDSFKLNSILSDEIKSRYEILFLDSEFPNYVFIREKDPNEEVELFLSFDNKKYYRLARDIAYRDTSMITKLFDENVGLGTLVGMRSLSEWRSSLQITATQSVNPCGEVSLTINC